MSGVGVTVCADPRDGNDSMEASVVLPVLPRKGDTLQVGVPAGLTILEVDHVSIEAWPGGRTEVWVSIHGYDRDELREVMAALKKRDTSPR